MDNKRLLSARDDSLFNDDGQPSGPPPMANFVITILFFLGIASCCAAVLIFFLRRRRRASRDVLPSYRQPSHQRHLTISTNGKFSKSPSIQVWEDKNSADGSSSATASVPELRITFPDDEEDDEKKGGRVVIVRVSDSGSVGMAPLNQDNLPPYQFKDSERFQSLDLERMGGLKEKEQGQRWS